MTQEKFIYHDLSLFDKNFLFHVKAEETKIKLFVYYKGKKLHEEVKEIKEEKWQLRTVYVKNKKEVEVKISLVCFYEKHINSVFYFSVPKNLLSLNKKEVKNKLKKQKKLFSFLVKNKCLEKLKVNHELAVVKYDKKIFALTKKWDYIFLSREGEAKINLIENKIFVINFRKKTELQFF